MLNNRSSRGVEETDLASPAIPSGAVSVSALTYRRPLCVLVDAVNEIRGLLDQQWVAV